VHLSNQEIVAMMAGASFAAGLNVYATIATLGLLARFQLLQLPPHLHLLQDWWVIAIALSMFVAEFFADKIPAFDLIWNALHTFIRVPIAALMAYGATAQLSPKAQILTALMASGIAFASHGGKMAVRAAVTPSPEPVSNMALSMGEDVAAVGLTWFATTHPYIAAGVTAVLVVLTFFAVRWVVRALKRLFRGASRKLHELQSPSRAA
jgi:uncharacterized membrane protein